VIAVETVVAAAFVVVAAAGVTGPAWLLVAGLAGHGVKDLWQHRSHFVANTRWWPPFCLVIDWVVAAILIVLLAAGVDFHHQVDDAWAGGRRTRKAARCQADGEVYANLLEDGYGGFAEYVSVPVKVQSLKPANLSFEEAAAVPMAGSPPWSRVWAAVAPHALVVGQLRAASLARQSRIVKTADDRSRWRAQALC
jgi:NADPH:quinone reductase-like Zn-dependent oxidoreductase